MLNNFVQQIYKKIKQNNNHVNFYQKNDQKS